MNIYEIIDERGLYGVTLNVKKAMKECCENFKWFIVNFRFISIYFAKKRDFTPRIPYYPQYGLLIYNRPVTDRYTECPVIIIFN